MAFQFQKFSTALGLHLLAVLVAFAAWPLAVSAQSARPDVVQLLNQRYGLAWAPDESERARWNCPEGRLDKPSGTVRYNWICSRPDPRFMRLVVWRADDLQSVRVERDNFRAMAGGKDAPHGEPDCHETRYQHPLGHLTGTLKTCSLPLPNGSFHVAFAHVDVGSSALSFVVRNASPQGSTPRVKEDLLSWLEGLKPANSEEKEK